MALTANQLRDLQYLADGRTAVGDPMQAIGAALLELLDRAGLTDTATGKRTIRAEATATGG